MLKFKHDEDIEMIPLLHPILLMIVGDLTWYAQKKYGIDLTITETITTAEDDARLGRTSASHQQGRAVDIRTKDIDIFIVEELVNYINTNPAYLKYHYISSKRKTKQLAYYHIGNAEHIHLAIHAKYAINY